LLGSHVRRRTGEGELLRALGEGRQAEVDDAGAALGVDEDVARLEVRDQLNS